ncbi:MAG: (2Fe-2S)-binding protein [Leptolyngbyaceae cyanobacterium MO_188.B28]|nr:(2Fe-2S)-binding protein [Leptolyngbyaceae cyanobacterium MO_188.B28]
MTKDCCADSVPSSICNCPVSGAKGKKVKIITLKSLLTSSALETLNPDKTHYFCSATDCPVVYFDGQGQVFRRHQVAVPVFQKDLRLQVPICYCFSWTRDRIYQEIQQTGSSTAETSILNHIKAGRCRCEINNPQGSCCLANIRTFMREVLQAKSAN